MNETGQEIRAVRRKETNFVSAVVYLHNEAGQAVAFFEKLNKELGRHFEHYEMIAVDDASIDDTAEQLRTWAEKQKIKASFTMIHMSLYQQRESCMNVGLDAAIGDYIYEFDSVNNQYDMELVFQAYQKVLEGNDIVSICPVDSRISSKLFYRVFNHCSNSSYPLQTDAFRLVTRRAVNRVYASSEYLPFRKAAYAASGLKMTFIHFPGKGGERQKKYFLLAVDSLVLYTSAGYQISMGITFLMACFAVLEMLYTCCIFCIGQPIEGWTTTMLVITFGFAGLFLILTIVIKYLSLILDFVFRKQRYLIEGIEKL